MLYVHEKNIITKIQEDYNGISNKINEFYCTEYKSVREKLSSLKFAADDYDTFRNAASIINEYLSKLNYFSTVYNIKSQSKFESSFLEEISTYLFKDIPEIKEGILGIYNKKIYAGIKLDHDNSISLITKDVDFCIGKKTVIKIGGQETQHLILPIVAVEVKTYLDATMFGEVKSSAKSIRSATPNSKTYVLIGYRSIAEEHIISARQDSVISEIFCLKSNKMDIIHWEVLRLYYIEIENAISGLFKRERNELGRLLHPNK